jgi:hypothetical protein
VDFSQSAAKNSTLNPSKDGQSRNVSHRIVACVLLAREPQGHATLKGILMPRSSKLPAAAATGPRLVQAKPAKPSQPEVSHAQIAMRAFELFADEGFMHGRDVEHWLRAERELKDVITPVRPKRVASSRARRA